MSQFFTPGMTYDFLLFCFPFRLPNSHIGAAISTGQIQLSATTGLPYGLRWLKIRIPSQGLDSVVPLHRLHDLDCFGSCFAQFSTPRQQVGAGGCSFALMDGSSIRELGSQLTLKPEAR